MKQGETRKTYVDVTLPLSEIEKRYNVSKSTAWRARKRGYFYKNYHVRQIANKEHDYNVTGIKQGVKYAFKLLCNFNISNVEKEDAIGNAILRYLELSDRVKDEKIAPFIAKTAQRNVLCYLRRKDKPVSYYYNE